MASPVGLTHACSLCGGSAARGYPAGKDEPLEPHCVPRRAVQVQIAGTGHYEAALKTGRFTPGALVRLVRQLRNAHDSNAVTVYAQRARNEAGYVPKDHARRLARLPDSMVLDRRRLSGVRK